MAEENKSEHKTSVPPEAQDKLLDNITALSAEGSRLVAEVFLNSSVNQEALNRAFRNWGDNGLDVELANLGFHFLLDFVRRNLSPYCGKGKLLQAAAKTRRAIC